MLHWLKKKKKKTISRTRTHRKSLAIIFKTLRCIQRTGKHIRSLIRSCNVWFKEIPGMPMELKRWPADNHGSTQPKWTGIWKLGNSDSLKGRATRIIPGWFYSHGSLRANISGKGYGSGRHESKLYPKIWLSVVAIIDNDNNVTHSFRLRWRQSGLRCTQQT